jgi:hypothetical protein
MECALGAIRVTEPLYTIFLRVRFRPKAASRQLWLSTAMFRVFSVDCMSPVR